MDHAAISQLFDDMYWVNHRLLDAAGRLPRSELTREAATTRNLRATLVHELDVEWSWRLALQGRPIEELGEDVELRPEDYPDLESIRRHWARDEAEMRAWLDSLADEQLAAEIVPALSDDSRPLSQYLLHIVFHAAQQQADAATLLTAAGESPGELGFLEYLRSAGRAG
ncbi:MAG TPA: DinB family protein [Candidatus Limnocylindria bacterium]|nr:DinB family protein [Candidatus Limnocylindria bacterium]